MKFDAAGGYRWLDSYVMASVIQLATFRFCEKFLSGKPMHKRKARTGKSAGQEFWGCTGYPECKGARSLG